MNGTTTLSASRDPLTGQLYVPPRRFAADGSLRECEAVQVAAQGVLLAHTSYGGTAYGLLDLDSGTRIQVRLLGDGPHTCGARYHGVRNEDGKVVFDHE